ncbi:MAG: hypothetical protein H0T46_34950 [Deltaproteobacteria bacterium]|nr:hypothetical protein [Deltaproteobacteria bacterium]
MIEALTRALALPDLVVEEDSLSGTVVAAVVKRIESFGLIAERAEGLRLTTLFVNIAPDSKTDPQEPFHVGQQIRVKLERRTVLGQYVGTLI